MNDIRCGSCRRLLARAEAQGIEIKCPRCGVLNIFHNPKATEPPVARRERQAKEALHGHQIR